MPQQYLKSLGSDPHQVFVALVVAAMSDISDLVELLTLDDSKAHIRGTAMEYVLGLTGDKYVCCRPLNSMCAPVLLICFSDRKLLPKPTTKNAWHMPTCAYDMCADNA